MHFFCACVMCWLQAIPLYPVYHWDEIKSDKNLTAVLHPLRILQVCGFRLFRGAMKSPRTHAFSVFHAVAHSVTVWPDCGSSSVHHILKHSEQVGKDMGFLLSISFWLLERKIFAEATKRILVMAPGWKLGQMTATLATPIICKEEMNQVDHVSFHGSKGRIHLPHDSWTNFHDSWTKSRFRQQGRSRKVHQRPIQEVL